MTVHSQTAKFGTSLLQNVTRSCSVTSAGPHRWPLPAASSPAVPLHGQKAWREFSLVTDPGPSCAVTAAVYCYQKFLTKLTQTTPAAAVGDG